MQRQFESEHGFCPLSGIEKRPLLGGCLSITTMVISIRNTDSVRCWEVVRFSEGPLSEVRLYTVAWRNTVQHANADALGRLPLPETPAQTTTPTELVLMMEQLKDAPISAKQIAFWTIYT